MTRYGLVILRVTVGTIYLMQAYLALFVSTPRGTSAFIAKLGFPTPILLALLLIVVHGVGGLMLIVGQWARLAAAANAAVVLLAILAMYVRQGLLIKGGILDVAGGRATPAGYEYILLLVAATIAIVFTGAGAAGASGGSRAK